MTDVPSSDSPKRRSDRKRKPATFIELTEKEADMIQHMQSIDDLEEEDNHWKCIVTGEKIRGNPENAGWFAVKDLEDIKKFKTQDLPVRVGFLSPKGKEMLEMS